jgi:copper chaperone CopZ
MSNPSGVAANHTAHYTVTGMTCGHCVMSVSEEVQEIAAVTDVQVDLDSGVVTITSDQPIADADVRAAIEAAGYQLA